MMWIELGTAVAITCFLISGKLLQTQMWGALVAGSVGAGLLGYIMQRASHLPHWVARSGSLTLTDFLSGLFVQDVVGAVLSQGGDEDSPSEPRLWGRQLPLYVASPYPRPVTGFFFAQLDGETVLVLEQETPCE